MKRFINSILLLIGRCLSFVLPFPVLKLLSSARDKLYTGYLYRRFGCMGQSVIMWRAYTLRGLQYVDIGDRTIVEPDVQLTVQATTDMSPHLSIGDDCLIRRGAHITCSRSISIGNGLLTGTNVFITDNAHGDTDFQSLAISPSARIIISKGPVVIGNNVWLGNNVCVLPGVCIGNGVVVGANSVVTHDLPDNCVAAGVPAKIIKQEKNE